MHTHAHTHACMHARTHARTHTHTHHSQWRQGVAREINGPLVPLADDAVQQLLQIHLCLICVLISPAQLKASVNILSGEKRQHHKLVKSQKAASRRHRKHTPVHTMRNLYMELSTEDTIGTQLAVLRREVPLIRLYTVLCGRDSGQRPH